MSYALYGDLEGYELYLPEGYVELTVPALGWGSTGSLQVDVLKYEAEKSVDELATIATTAQQTTIKISGASAEVTEVDQITLGFQNAEKARYLIKLSTTAKGNGFAIAGLTVSNDPLAVFVETFADVADNYTPGVGSGWNVYESTLKDKGVDYYSNDKRGSRVFTLASTELSHAMHHQSYGIDATRYETYGEAGEGEPTLTLDAGKYQISFNAAIWSGTPDVRFYLLDESGTTVASLVGTPTASASGSKTTVFTPDLFTLTADVETAGNYILKFTSTGQIVYGNIVIRKDLTTALDETFSGLSHAVPAAGSGWYLYDNSGTLIAQGSKPNSGPRFFGISGYSAVTNVGYLGSGGSSHLTYGEDGSGKTLTLVGGKEYRITYYAANWDGNTEYPRQLKCSIDGKNDEGNVFSRTDALAGKCNNNAWGAEYVTNPDFIQATFTPKTSGNYVLTFSGDATIVSNISIKDNDEENIAFKTTLDQFGYTSLYLDQAVELPSDAEVTAYIGALNEDNNALILTALEGDVLPAQTAVILIGEANAALTLHPSSATVSVPDGNILKGNVTGTKASSSEDVYVLGSKSTDDAPAFYKHSTKKINATTVTTIVDNLATAVTTSEIQEGTTTSEEVKTVQGEAVTTTKVTNSDGTETEKTTVNYTAGTKTKNYEYVRVIPANKVYLVVPASGAEAAPSIRIQFAEDVDEPGNVTAIERIETEAAPAARAIFDLSGRRVFDMSKPGLYIMGGRKVMVK
jgi:hypothetical protein